MGDSGSHVLLKGLSRIVDEEVSFLELYLTFHLYYIVIMRRTPYVENNERLALKYATQLRSQHDKKAN